MLNKLVLIQVILNFNFIFEKKKIVKILQNNVHCFEQKFNFFFEITLASSDEDDDDINGGTTSGYVEQVYYYFDYCLNLFYYFFKHLNCF